MKGEIFHWDHFERHPESEFPNTKEMKVYIGVDLAIGEKESNDLFALVVLGVKDGHYWGPICRACAPRRVAMVSA